MHRCVPLWLLLSRNTGSCHIKNASHADNALFRKYPFWMFEKNWNVAVFSVNVSYYGVGQYIHSKPYFLGIPQEINEHITNECMSFTYNFDILFHTKCHVLWNPFILIFFLSLTFGAQKQYIKVKQKIAWEHTHTNTNVY